MLTNPYIIAIAIPLILILSGGFAKKLVRGSSFQWKDFYLGVEMTLATLGASLTNFFDLRKLDQNGHANIDPANITKNATFLAVSFFSLLIIMTVHQEWESRNQAPQKQLFWLGIFANLIGAGLMIAFTLFVKGV